MADVISSPRPASEESDPFQHLHKMSTTAGLGSGDYVAINGSAIVAILLGVGSAIVLFDSRLLLTIPFAGVLCAILAFYQIAHSNGTQTGRAVAAVGLLLSLGFGGFYATKTFYQWVHHRADEDQIVALIHRYGEFTKAKDYASAYNLLDDQMKAKVSEPVFEGVSVHVATSPLLGNLEMADWNKLLLFDTDQVTGEQVANGMVKLKYTNSPETIRVGMVFRNIDGKWFIDQIPSFFQEQPQQPSKQSAAAPTYGPLGPPKPQ